MIIDRVFHVGCMAAVAVHILIARVSLSSCACISTHNCVKPVWYNESWSTTELRELLDVLFNCYDNRVRPTYKVQSPVVISIDMFIQSISKISVRDMEYTISLYLRQRWHDPRLAYNNMYKEDSITLGHAILAQVWTPDSHFVNKKESVVLSSTGGRIALFRIFRNGSVLYSTESTVTIGCYMNLRRFPMDDQKCYFTVESFGFTTEDILFKWYKAGPSQNNIQTAKELDATEFSIVSMVTKEHINEFTTGNYSALTVEISMARRTTYYIIQIYIPCIMIVMLSWISFWIDYHSVPARTALGITTVLAMTTLLFGIQSSLPGVPYIKAVDLFLIVSFACVFVALIEFAVVNFLSSYDKTNDGITMKKYHKYDMADAYTLQFENEAYNGEAGANNNNPTMPQEQGHATANGTVNTGRPKKRKKSKSFRSYWAMNALAIDRYSRAVFPLAYTIFLIVYFITNGHMII